MTVKVAVNGENGPILMNRTIHISDVGDFGDTGWELVNVTLPPTPIGQATYFGFEATVTNVGDYALDSLAYLDAFQIAPCSA